MEEITNGEFEKKKKEILHKAGKMVYFYEGDIDKLEQLIRQDERARIIGIIRSIVDNPKCADNRKDDDFAQGYDFAYDEIRKEIDKLKGEI